MHNKRYYCIILLALLCTGNVVNAQENEITTVFLVRHAEKESDSRDPELSAEGRDRANELAKVLGSVELDAIYDTPFIRTRDTAKPTAEKLGITVETIQSLQSDDLKMFMENTLKNHKGGKILIVSHSNIIPAIIKMIRGEDPKVVPMEYINDNVYDDLFIVSFTNRKSVQVMNLKYGKLSLAK